MIRFSPKKLSHLILTVYLALCVTGAFSFAVSDSLSSGDFMTENSISERSGSVDDYLVQHPAEEPVIINKLCDVPFSPLRVVFQRAAFPLGSPGIGNSFSESSFKANLKIPHTNSKDTILLKLRI
jgi:hypothetical protein